MATDDLPEPDSRDDEADAPRGPGEPSAGRRALEGLGGPGGRWIWYALIAGWLIFILGQGWWENTQVTTIPYSEFLALERAGDLEDLSIGSEVITGRFREQEVSRPDAFRTVRALCEQTLTHKRNRSRRLFRLSGSCRY